MNKRLLESKMKLFGDTNETLAAAIGRTPQSLSAKKNATKGADFTQEEIFIIKERYSLTPDELADIFFAS